MIYGNTTNCSVVGHGTITAYECRLGYEVISADTSTNTRKVKLQLEARTINSKYTTSGWQLTPIIDGVTLNKISINLVTANVWQVLGTREITVVGAYSGTKYGSFTTNLSNEWGLKSGSASVTINLDNLHTPPAITTITTSEKNTLLNNAYQFVQYLSIKELEFEVTTYDNATISSYQVHHNGVLIGSNTSNKVTINFNDVGTLATYEMDGKTWCTLKFVAIDSYGTMGSFEAPYEVIKYTRPNLVQTSSSIKRNGQLTGKVKLNLIGTFFEQAVNGINNTISLKYAYWKKGGNESTTYYNIPFTPTDNNINLHDWNVAKNNTEITDVDKNSAYYFKIKATDHFNKTSEITLLCPVGEYLWAEFKDRVDFKKLTIQGTPVNAKNQVVLWTNPNPSSNFDSQIITTEDMTDYDVIGIWFWRNGNLDRLQEIRVRNFHKSMAIVGSSYGGGCFGYFENGTTYIQSRTFTIVSDTQISFTGGYLNTTADNTRAIPMYVVGYKDSAFND